MVYALILAVVAIVVLIIATITDLRTREVPDWLSYGLVFLGLGINLIFSLIYWDYSFIVNSLAGFTLFLILALAMFYTGQWGGGDSKVLIGLGALIGLDIMFFKSWEIPFLFDFFINILLVGALYGLLWSLSLIFRNLKGFRREFKKILVKGKVKRFKRILFAFVIVMLLLALYKSGSILSFVFVSILVVSLVIFYLGIAVKAIEKACMVKSVVPSKLTEGDWIVKDIKHKGKYICGPKDLGIEKKQIRELVKLYKQNKIKRVLIKEGIPFVPSFLFAYVLTLFFGNLLFLLLV
ncbi:MAG: prepilin peptidase [Nanoarchaeota archaeon]|nr:prepilin peptidase [Nanoarchaeota archaeon]